MTWSDWMLQYEVTIRLFIFFGVFGFMASWEVIAPKRSQTLSRLKRWPANIGIVILNSLVLRLIFPTAAVGVALFAEEQHWGLFNNLHYLGIEALPFYLSILICVITLDLIIYLQHLMFHAVPFFWRLHQVHHADLGYDVTTGARFHTLEILMSMLIKISAIVLLGPPVVAVVIFEILLNATAMFNHSNVRIPHKMDRLLRRLIVTPDMHRVHHSSITKETNSNFGFNLPWWDRLFGTYVEQPSQGHSEMNIGLSNFRDPKQTNGLIGMLTLPFKDIAYGYSVKKKPSEHNSGS